MWTWWLQRDNHIFFEKIPHVSGPMQFKPVLSRAATVYPVDGIVESSYVRTDFLPEGFVYSDREVLKSPTVIVDSSFSPSVLSVFASCSLILCC